MPAKAKVSSKVTSNNPKFKQLFRSLDNKMLGGVCGGIAEYFEIDPSLVRLIFVVITLLGGSGLLVYIVLWLVMPTPKSNTNPSDVVHQNAAEMKATAAKLGRELKVGQGTTMSFGGIFLILIGLILLAKYLGFFRLFDSGLVIGAVFVVLGAIMLLKRQD